MVCTEILEHAGRFHYTETVKEGKTVNDEVLEMMTQLMTDVRLEDIVRENQEYQQALKEERAIYEKFRKLLNQEQKDLLEEFLAASSESACVYDRLSYQQGMRDLFALFQSLAR
jgi:hypothetical protein